VRIRSGRGATRGRATRGQCSSRATARPVVGRGHERRRRAARAARRRRGRKVGWFLGRRHRTARRGPPARGRRDRADRRGGAPKLAASQPGVASFLLALWPTIPAEEAVVRRGAPSATRQRTIEANGIDLRGQLAIRRSLVLAERCEARGGSRSAWGGAVESVFYRLTETGGGVIGGALELLEPGHTQRVLLEPRPIRSRHWRWLRASARSWSTRRVSRSLMAAGARRVRRASPASCAWPRRTRA
jgi:hypothetical protein